MPNDSHDKWNADLIDCVWNLPVELQHQVFGHAGLATQYLLGFLELPLTEFQVSLLWADAFLNDMVGVVPLLPCIELDWEPLLIRSEAMELAVQLHPKAYGFLASGLNLARPSPSERNLLPIHRLLMDAITAPPCDQSPTTVAAALETIAHALELGSRSSAQLESAPSPKPVSKRVLHVTWTGSIVVPDLGTVAREMVDWVLDRIPSLQSLPSRFAETLLSCAAGAGRLDVVQQLSKGYFSGSVYAFAFASEHGHLDIVRYFCENGFESQISLAGSVRGGQLGVYMYLASKYAQSPSRAALRSGIATRRTAVVWWLLRPDNKPMWANAGFSWLADDAAEFGDLPILEYVVHHRIGNLSHDAMDNAASSGHLHILEWLHKHTSEGCTSDAMDNAARHGHLDVVKWLHRYTDVGCTKRAMDGAAQEGHVDVVRWLHFNRREGCTTEAMDVAAIRGHLHVVKFLHEHRREGCTITAMDWAAGRNQLDVVKWLHENRHEGCSKDAMNEAAENGHLEMVQWLHANRKEGCSKYALNKAVENGHLEVVKFLLANRREGCSATTLERCSVGMARILYEGLRPLQRTLLTRAARRKEHKTALRRLQGDFSH